MLFEQLLERLRTAALPDKRAALESLLAARTKRKREDPLAFHVPHDAQIPFHKSLRRERWIIGANRSGKTEAGAAEDVWWAVGRHPFREVPLSTDGWVISETYQVQTARNGIQDKILRLMPPSKIAKPVYREKQALDVIFLTCNRCGGMPNITDDSVVKSAFCPACAKPTSTITFKTYDQDRKVFQAAAIHWAHPDEEPPKPILNEIRTRLVDYGGHLWCTETPVEGMTYTYDEISEYFESVKDDDARWLDVFTMSMYDNPHLSRKYIEEYRAKLKDQTEIDIRILGKHRALSGLIYKGWEPSVHEIGEQQFKAAFLDEEEEDRNLGKIRPSFETWVGIDTGSHFAASFWLVDYFGNLWGFDEYERERGTIMEHCEEVKRKIRGWGISPNFVVDRSSQFKSELMEFGLYGADSMAWEVEVGIEVTKDYIHARTLQASKKDQPPDKPGIVVVKGRMPGWLRERARYQWDKPNRTGPSEGQPKTKPRKADDHLLDSSRYVIQLRPSASVPPPHEDHRPIHKIKEAEVRKKFSRDRADEESDSIYRDE